MKKRLLSLALVLTMICELYLMKNDIALPAEAVAAGFVHSYTLTGNPATDIVRIALTQEGRTGSQMGYGTEWCAYFVADCAELAGADDVIPYTGWVPTMIDAIDGYTSTNDPRPGDICFYDWNRNSSPDHVEIVYDVTSSAIYTIGGNSGSGGSYSTRSVKTHCYSRDSADILKIIRPNYSGSTPTRTIASEYADYLPMRAYPIATGNITVYDQYGSAYSNRYITGSTDFCYIWEIYTDGWCKVEYPSTAESSGWFTAYVPFSVFASSPSPTTWTSGGQCTAYRRSDLSQAINSGYNTIPKGSSCLVVKSSGNLKQVIYPVSGTTYYAMGWISAPSYTYSFDFNANGGTLGETGAFTTTYGSEFQILNTTCVRSGYTWAGWNIKRNTDNKWYVNGVGWCTESEISSNGYTKNVYSNYMTCTLDDSWINGISGDASFTFYAVWKAVPVELSANSTNSVAVTVGGEMRFFTYTPSVSGTYVIYSTGSDDTEAAYLSSDKTESGSDDDSGENRNFRIECYLTAGTKYTFGIRYYNSTKTGTITFKFGRVYTITYNANGGSGAPAPQKKDYGTDITLSSTIPTRDGYTFLGWATSSSATSAVYQPDGTFSNNANYTLYAVWEKNCASGHSYNSGVVTKPATCTTTGVKTYTCTVCGNTKTETLSVIGHAWQAATCLTPKTCTSCGTTTGNIGAHNVVDGICTVCNRYGTCGDNLIWMLDVSGTLTISGTGAMNDFDYDSSSPTGYTQPWKNAATSIKRVVIGNGVTAIGDYAFKRCTNLNSVTISNSVTIIGEESFRDCVGLADVTIPDSVTSIARCAFYGCTGLSSVVIGNGVISIGDWAFIHCSNLINVTIGNNVTSIGEYTFTNCTSLIKVNITDVTAWCNISFENAEANPLYFAGNLYVNNQLVTELVIPSGTTIIKDRVFYQCTSLTSVMIPDSVTSIDEYVFVRCSNLSNVVIGNGVTNIGKSAFYTNGITSVIYCGTEDEWNRIIIGDYNTSLTNAKRSYHSYDNDADTTCNICGVVRQVGPAKDANLVFNGNPGLSFKDYIGMQLLASNDVLSGYDQFYIKAVQETPDGVVETTLNGTLYYGVYQKFEQPILSWSMAERVTLTLYGVKNGVTYEGATITTSVAQLAMEKIDTYYNSVNLNACKALVDMLNYGAAVQTAYGRNTANLPNASLGKYSALGTSATPSFDASNNKTGTGTVTVLNDSISMRAKVEIQLLFQGDISAYNVNAVLGNTAVSTVIDKNTYASYGWTILKIAVDADKLRDNLTLALYDANGKPVTQIYNVSVEAYAKGQLGGTYNDVVIAMMRYGDSVAAL